MGVRKQSEHNIRKLTKLGKKSLAVTLPVEIVGKLKLKERQKVKVTLKGRTILIRDWRKSTKASRDGGRPASKRK